MDLVNRLLGRRFGAGGSSPSDPPAAKSRRYKYKGPKLPQTPLTPREIEELHANLHPEQHQPSAFLAQRPIFDSLDWKVPYALSLEEKFSSADAERALAEVQSRSLLFARLPRELRMLIWRYAMGSRKLYLTARRGQMVQSRTMDDYDWWPKRGLLNVPMVCRAVYMESISYLYSNNTFCFGFGSDSSKLPLTGLHDVLPKQHVASIRHVQMGWHLVRGVSQYYDSHPQAWDLSLDIPAPETDEMWHKVCAELAKLSRLQSLTIIAWATGDRRAELADQEQDMLEPLVGMKHVKWFEIVLPWMQRDHTSWTDAPFNVSRRFENRERYGASVPLLDDVL